MSDRSGYSTQRRRSVGGLVVAVVVVVVVLVAAVVFLVTRGGSDKSAGDAGQSTSTAAGGAQASASATGAAGVTSDFWGRRVVLPANPDGDVIPQKPVDTTDACNPVNYSRVPDDLTAQRTHKISTLWSSTDGPTGFTDGVPSGYSHTPQGAALAFWNYYSMFTIGGMKAYHSMLNFGGLSDADKEDLKGLGKQPTEESARDYTSMVAPSAVKFTSCRDDMVVVEYFLKSPDPQTGAASKPKYQPMVAEVHWVDGHWEAALDSKKSVRVNDMTDEIDGEATRWEY
ncbi:hypothetical protein [Corynebacterium bovis]|uniref:hypothetical protein n=1 Tax=Corynebacterium bovis TaxID=36808 RepID=UPI000F64D299|nr:hypothetical protein [Corynebacterium bovis]